MTGTYTLKVVSDFAAAHRLDGYAGACSRLHGHNWKIETEIQADTLDDIGIGMDFKTIKAIVKTVIDELDHQNLNDLPPFQHLNPTAEHIATYLYKEIGRRLEDPNTHVQAITVWETERACVRYSEVA